MTPREIRTAGWVNKRRSGQRRGYCDRGLRSTEFPGRCTRIGSTSLSGSPRKESACKERRPRRSSAGCAREAARPEDYHVRTPSAARLREVFRLETERWISNDWVVQYRGHFLQLKPQNKRYGPTQAQALICEWEDGAVEVHYRGERMDYEDLVVRPRTEKAAPREPCREPAKQVGSKRAQEHPWRQGYEQRMKLQKLNRSQESALLGVSACATP